MIVVIDEKDLYKAKEIFARYNSKIAYTQVPLDNKIYLAVNEGPIGALLELRAKIADPELQKRFGL